MNQFTYEVTHDSGSTKITVMARNEWAGVKQVMDAEKCPRSAIVQVFPAQSFRSHIGCEYTDWWGGHHGCYQLVGTQDGRAWAILDRYNGKDQRFMAADSIADIADDWRSTFR